MRQPQLENVAAATSYDGRGDHEQRENMPSVAVVWIQAVL